MKVIITGCLILLCACASQTGYRQFYTPATWATPEAVASHRVGPPPKVPALEHIEEANSERIAVYERQGFQLVGYSKFTSGHSLHDQEALDQGAAVTADLVVVSRPRLLSSQTVSVPLTLPTTQTSQTSGNATAYGSAGTVTAYGSSTTTTYGTRTSYMPMTVHRFDYGALFFIKAKPSPFGVMTRDTNDEERAALQTNKGAVVGIVIDDSPAFRADILTGDTILSVDGLPVYGTKSLGDLIKARYGKPIDVGLLRNGQVLTKTVQLGQ